MAKKSEQKLPKYKEGDILKYTNPISKNESMVTITRRYDIKPFQRVAWYYKSFPDGIEEYGAPENEFSLPDNE